MTKCKLYDIINTTAGKRFIAVHKNILTKFVGDGFPVPRFRNILFTSRAGRPRPYGNVINTTGGDIVAKNLKLKSARAAMDMSQQALAEKVGVSRQTINAIEKGDYNPTLNLCVAICKALGKTLDEVFWGE